MPYLLCVFPIIMRAGIGQRNCEGRNNTFAFVLFLAAFTVLVDIIDELEPAGLILEKLWARLR